jgi:hypothetical protein
LHVASLLGAVKGKVVVKANRGVQSSHVGEGKDFASSVSAIKHVLHLASKTVASHPDKAKSSSDWLVLLVLCARDTIYGISSDAGVSIFVPELGHRLVEGLQVASGTAKQISQTRGIENNFDHSRTSKLY